MGRRDVLKLIVRGKTCHAFEEVWWKAVQMWADRIFTLTEIHLVPWGRKSVIKTWPICGCQTCLSYAFCGPVQKSHHSSSFRCSKPSTLIPFFVWVVDSFRECRWNSIYIFLCIYILCIYIYLPCFTLGKTHFRNKRCVCNYKIYAFFHLFFRLTLTLSCPMDLKNFPMDVQTCIMQLESCE